MPSPFPGMDPYLEHPALWPGVHQRLITYLGDALNALLPLHYVANIGERLYVVQSERSIYPDVVVVEPPAAVFLPERGTSGTAAVLHSDPSWVLTVDPIERREVFIEILSVGETSRVVTVIEVLSPSNKTAGSERTTALRNQAARNLAEPNALARDRLAALRRARCRRTARKPLEKGTWTYLVCLHRGGKRGHYEVWPTTLRQRLPRIRVPLAHDDADVVIDLQTVFTRCYDEGAYARRLDYRQDPPTPLANDDLAWVATRLREQGRRA